MRLMAWLLALGAAIPSYAQEQSTSGSCNPAIAGVNGSVNINCGTKDHDDRVDRAIRELIGDKPFTLNAPYLDYGHYVSGKIHKNGIEYTDFYFIDGTNQISVDVLVDGNNVVREIDLVGVDPSFKQKYIDFNKKIGRSDPKFYQNDDDADFCYDVSTWAPDRDGFFRKPIQCAELSRYPNGACEVRNHVETDGVNKIGDVEFTIPPQRCCFGNACEFRQETITLL